jgi:hypothetical protein
MMYSLMHAQPAAQANLVPNERTATLQSSICGRSLRAVFVSHCMHGQGRDVHLQVGALVVVDAHKLVARLRRQMCHQ